MKKILCVFVTAFLACNLYAGSTIITATNIVTGNEKAAQLANSNFARQISVGTNWTVLRVGIRFRFDNAENSIGTDSQLVIGACSGTNSLFFDSTVTNFVGFTFTNATWTVSGTYFTYSTARGRATSKAGSTVTNTPVGDISGLAAAKSNELDTHAVAEMILVTITKGSPNYTVSRFTRNNTSAASNATKSTFLGLMSETTPTLSNYADVSAAVKCDETPGNFDTITVGWNRSTVVLTVFDLAVSKLQ